YEKFRAENPKTFAAVNKAYDDALAWINADKRRAARLYIEMTNERKLTEDDLTLTFSGQDMEYTKVPSRLGKIVDFLHRVGFVEGSVLPGGLRPAGELKAGAGLDVAAATRINIVRFPACAGRESRRARWTGR